MTFDHFNLYQLFGRALLTELLALFNSPVEHASWGGASTRFPGGFLKRS